MRLAWLTDIHLNFVGADRLWELMVAVERSADIVAISGDIAESPSVSEYLAKMARFIRKPIYFVLGNHGGYFSHVLNNALLHVFSAMAGNHFLAIADLLDHPAIHGGYTRLMPAYLFTVLLGKVDVLRNITQEMEIEE